MPLVMPMTDMYRKLRSMGGTYSSFELAAAWRPILANGRYYDAHCKRCGSLLYSVVRDGAFVHIALGTLVDDPAIRATAHIFVGSKAPWFTITDDLPQHEEFESG